MGSFTDELIAFIKQHGFSNVVILTSTISPVKRERESNRQIPEVFGYINDHLEKDQPNYYEDNGVRRFGYWIQDVKKRPH